MAMFYVEKQPWQRWPKVLTVCRKNGDETERRRYVPEETCTVECVYTYLDGQAGERYMIRLSCHAIDDWGDSEPPAYCPECGRKVEK